MHRLVKAGRLFLIFFTFSFLFTGCFDFEEVDFKGVDNYEMDTRNMSKSELTLYLRVDNPNDFKITIKPTKLDLLLNGKKVTDATIKEKVIIDKNCEKSYPLVLVADGNKIVKAGMQSLGTLLGGQTKLGVKGKIKAKAFGIGKKFDVDFAQPVDLRSFGG